MRFEQQLLAAATERDIRTHPLLQSVRTGEYRRETLGLVAQMLHDLASRFPPLLATLFTHAPAGRIRAHLLRNLMEEEGLVVQDGEVRYVPERRHVALARRFTKAFGQPQRGGTEWESPWIAQELVEGRWLAVASYLMVGFEGNVPVTIGALLPPLREIYGLTDDQLVFFTEHAEADADHSRIGAELITEACRSEEDRHQALEGARRGGRAWWWLLRACEHQMRRSELAARPVVHS